MVGRIVVGRFIAVLGCTTVLLLLGAATAFAAQYDICKPDGTWVGAIKGSKGSWNILVNKQGLSDSVASRVNSTLWKVWPIASTSKTKPYGKVAAVKVSGKLRWTIYRYVKKTKSYTRVGYARKRSSGGWNIRRKWSGKNIGYVTGGKAGAAGGGGLRRLLT